MGSQVSGRVEKVLVEVGDLVKKDQELLCLDPTFFNIEVAQRKSELQAAQVAMTDAELNFNRMKNLWEKPNSKEPPSVSRKIYDDARLKFEATTAQYQQAQHGVRYAEQRLRETVVRAPYDAVVSKRMVDPGQPVTATPATSLIEVQEVATLDLDFSLPQNMLGNIKVQTPFEFEVEGIENGKGTGTIALIFPVIDEATRSFRCRAWIQNPDLKYRPGLLAQIRVLNREIKNSLVVPRKALIQTATDWRAVVSNDGHISTRALNVGLVTDTLVEILGGVREGHKVFVPEGK
jgi:membrane fusion protein (multidrug efflux system)